jgi:hypothetical protein
LDLAYGHDYAAGKDGKTSIFASLLYCVEDAEYYDGDALTAANESMIRDLVKSIPVSQRDEDEFVSDLFTRESTHPEVEWRPCCCLDGWVYIGRIVDGEAEHDLDGEVEVIEAVPCRRCVSEAVEGGVV